VPLMKLGFGVGFGWFAASVFIELFRYLLLHLAMVLGLPL